MPKLLTEFVGTFFLTLTVLIAAVGGHAGPAAPLAIGLILTAMVYMGGPISGAHYNPAVTLAVWARGKIALPQAAGYWVVQLAAAFVAALVAHTIDAKIEIAAPSPTASMMNDYILEILFTFALALVVLNVATAKATAGNSYFGVAIGMTVAAAAYTVGSISGGTVNPAVAVGPILFDLIRGSTKAVGNIPLFILGPLAGGALAALVFKLQHPDE